MTFGVDDIARITHEVKRRCFITGEPPWERLADEVKDRYRESTRKDIDNPKAMVTGSPSENVARVIAQELRGYM